MNELTQSQPEHNCDPIALDRLVDGELPEAERRQLLSKLDRQPGGWRQCALAFLEAQSWGQALTHFVRHPTAIADASQSPRSELSVNATPNSLTEIAPAVSPRGRNARDKRWTWWLALASSFLITFSLGMYIQQLWHVFHGGPGSDQIASAPLSIPTNAVSTSSSGREQPRQIEIPIVSAAIVDIPQMQTLEQTVFVLREIQVAMSQRGYDNIYCRVPVAEGRESLMPIPQAIAWISRGAGR